MLKIEFESIDGGGKTTAVKYFVEKARSIGLSVVETREVGNPHLESCVKMRQFVLDPANKLSGEAMELIFSAMRIESDTWLKNLSEGENPPDLVVSDRGFFSHLAYGLHNTSERFVNGLFRDLMANITDLPDVVIYFNVDTNVAKQRMINRGQAMDVIELKGTDFQDKVRESFLHYLEWYDKKEPVFDGRIFYVDANQDIEGVRRQLDKILKKVECHMDRYQDDLTLDFD